MYFSRNSLLKVLRLQVVNCNKSESFYKMFVSQYDKIRCLAAGSGFLTFIRISWLIACVRMLTEHVINCKINIPYRGICGGGNIMESKECCCEIKVRSQQEYKDLINRLNRIEGQIRGIKSMVEEERYCIDIITQVAAANAALNSFNKVLLENHIRSCVVDDIKEGNDNKLEELVNTLQKLMK